jgi:hypothetical protein
VVLEVHRSAVRLIEARSTERDNSRGVSCSPSNRTAGGVVPEAPEGGLHAPPGPEAVDVEAVLLDLAHQQVDVARDVTPCPHRDDVPAAMAASTSGRPARGRVVAEQEAASMPLNASTRRGRTSSM